MNKSAFFGIIAIGVVVYFGILNGLQMKEILFNSHALILVIGGTASVTFFTYNYDRLMDVFEFISKGFFFKKIKDEETWVKDLLFVIKAWYKNSGQPFLSNGRNHPFIEESINLLNASNVKISVLEMAHILKSRKGSIKRKYQEDARVLQNIAKYPPALGLLGACSGIIKMMISLGAGGGMDSVGPAMAIALTATLWGIFMNNFIFLPLADNAQKAVDDEMHVRDTIIEAILLMKKGCSEEVVTEVVVSKLRPKQRLEIKAQEFMKNEETKFRKVA